MIHKDCYMDSTLNKIIGETIKKEREKKQLTLEQLANKINKVSRQTLSTYETGRSKIKISMFLDICQALGLDPQEMFDEINMKYFKNAKL